ncbi:MAG: carbohydrate kinase [Methylotenera sp.]|uniref:carbohydrate kinase family protein n=1 Tax=Methylotenera sp. TaxID=2051956 RepID=UPI002489DA58|nr:carbohydrate kinase [Methylotenera sp.]MDI1309860.1 carbohydrate kinase [Methylotenera sp.]
MIFEPNNPTYNKRVTVFGEILADVYPEYSLLGGAPFNVARHLHAFGLNPFLISRIGTDSLANDVLSEMEIRGLETSGIQRDLRSPTGQVKVTLNNGIPEYEILAHQAYDFIDYVPEEGTSKKSEIIYFGSLAQRCPQSSTALDDLLARNESAKKFLDLNLRQPWYNEHTINQSLQQANIVKLNEEELEEVCQMFGLQSADLHLMGKNLVSHFKVEHLLITSGENGSWSILNHELQLTPPYKTLLSARDTVGAGDAFSAVIILGYMNHWDMQLTQARANQFASAICEIQGAVPESLDFYKPYLFAWHLYS